MDKRDTILALLALGTAPLVSLAQPPNKVWRIGFLAADRLPNPIGTHFFGALPKRLHELGYVEGKNLVMEWRAAEGKYERLSDLAAELLRLNVDLIVAPQSQGIAAAMKATATIPIVMGSSNDPVISGFVKSLARPGANVTGLSNFSVDLSPKYLELLIAPAPKISRVAVLWNPSNAGILSSLKSIEATAHTLGKTILPFELQAKQDAESAFLSMSQSNAEALIVLTDAAFTFRARQFAVLAAKYRLPTMGPFRDYAEAGFLMSYGHSRVQQYRRVAEIVDKILKGAKPGDLPVEQPTTIELVINLRTAKALNLSIPSSLLLRAEELLE